MEIITNEPIDVSLIADLAAIGMERKPPTPRDGSKWHVTSLLRAGQQIARGNTGYSDDSPVPDNVRSCGHLGRIWETVIDCYLTHYADRQGGIYIPDVESVTDGVIASLDGLLWLPELGWMVSETKLRFSLREDIPLNHIQQVRAYCHCASTDIVCYTSGHISTTPPTVRARRCIFRLTERSIEECWRGIINTRDYLVSQGISPAGNGDDGE